MNIDKALTQLADPNVSGKKKRDIMDKLNEQTTQKQQDTLMNALIGLGAGGLGAIAGGVTGRKLAQKAIQKNDRRGIETFVGGGLMPMKLGPKSMRETAEALDNKISRGIVANIRKERGSQDSIINPDAPFEERVILGDPLSDTNLQSLQRRISSGERALVDAATGLGAGATASYVSAAAPGLAGPLTMKDVVPQPPEARAAIERVATGTATQEDLARIKKYYEGASSTGGFLPWLSSALVGAALSIPTLYIGGPAAGRLARRYKLPIASTARGRELVGEMGFDALAGTALGSAGASMTYNALSSPYEEPF